MADVAAVIKKRWRAWLRSFHRDFGYLAIGFTVIYAVSGIAQNHIEDWGDVSYKVHESTRAVAEIPAATPDDKAIAIVASVAGLGKPTAALRAGDEIRLEYANGSKATAIGTQLTIQSRERRAFIGAANWLHTARQKKGWKYVSDAFACLLLYLAISGIFMIKGKLGIKGRGAILISIGVAVPICAVLFSSPQRKNPAAVETAETAEPPAPSALPAATPPTATPPAATSPAAAGPSATPPAAGPSATPAPAAAGSAASAADQAKSAAGSNIQFLPPDDE